MKKHVLVSAAISAALLFGATLPVFAGGEVPSAGLEPVKADNGLTVTAETTSSEVFSEFHNNDINVATAKYGFSNAQVASKMSISLDSYDIVATAVFDVSGDAASVAGATFTGVYGIAKGDMVAVLHVKNDGTGELLAASAPADNAVKVAEAPSSLSPFVILKGVKKSSSSTSSSTTSTTTSTTTTSTSTSTKTGYNVPNTADRG